MMAFGHRGETDNLRVPSMHFLRRHQDHRWTALRPFTTNPSSSPTMRIDGNTFLVSGSSSGLGLACVVRLLEQGANVLGIDLTPAPEGLRSLEGEHYCHAVADVTDEAAVRGAIALGLQRWGGLSGAVCCAGILHGERLLGRHGPASLNAFRRVLDINLTGSFNVVRLAAEAIATTAASPPDGERGVLILTSSIAAFEGQIGQCAYAASKGAIASMVLPMARELGPMGIRVMSIAPGVFDTPMLQSASEQVRRPLLELAVFPKRFGLPEEFAATVQHILENSMLNGTVLRLDGGLRMPR